MEFMTKKYLYDEKYDRLNELGMTYLKELEPAMSAIAVIVNKASHDNVCLRQLHSLLTDEVSGPILMEILGKPGFYNDVNINKKIE
jgi:hypothetical protein